MPSSGRDHNHTSFLVSSSCRLLVFAYLVSLWALGSSSWKKAKISGTHRAGMSGERGQSGLQRRLWGIWVETAGAEGHLLTTYGCELTAFRLAGRVQSLGRWKERGQQRKCLSHVEKKISAMPETQTVNPSLKVFPACTQLWVFFSSSKRPSALKLYRNSQLKPHQDRFLGLEWGTKLTVHILIYLHVVAPTSPPASSFWGFQCPRQSSEIWTLNVTIFRAAAWELSGHTHATGRCHQSVPCLLLHMMGQAVQPTRAHPGFTHLL